MRILARVTKVDSDSVEVGQMPMHPRSWTREIIAMHTVRPIKETTNNCRWNNFPLISAECEIFFQLNHDSII